MASYDLTLIETLSGKRGFLAVRGETMSRVAFIDEINLSNGEVKAHLGMIDNEDYIVINRQTTVVKEP